MFNQFLFVSAIFNFLLRASIFIIINKRKIKQITEFYKVVD